jgi:hypothetical protein
MAEAEANVPAAPDDPQAEAEAPPQHNPEDGRASDNDNEDNSSEREEKPVTLLNSLDIVPRPTRRVIEESFGDKPLAVLKCWFLGSRPCNLNLDDDPDRTINHVLREEMERFRARKKREKPIKVCQPRSWAAVRPAARTQGPTPAGRVQVVLVVSEDWVGTVSRETNALIQHVPSYMVEEVLAEDSKRFPLAVAFSHHNSRVGIDYVSVIEVKEKYFHSLEPALETAARRVKAHRKSKVDARALGIKHRMVGVKNGLYLGKLAVSKKNGDATVVSAVAQLRRQIKRKKERLLNATIVINKDSIVYMEALTDDVLFEGAMTDVTFATLLEVCSMACWRNGHDGARRAWAPLHPFSFPPPFALCSRRASRRKSLPLLRRMSGLITSSATRLYATKGFLPSSARYTASATPTRTTHRSQPGLVDDWRRPAAAAAGSRTESQRPLCRRHARGGGSVGGTLGTEAGRARTGFNSSREARSGEGGGLTHAVCFPAGSR